MTLHRAILRASDHAILEPSVLEMTRSAIMTRLLSVVDFVKQLKPVHLQSFWYSASSPNLALVATLGGLLWSSCQTAQERDTIKAALSDYRWTLRTSGAGANLVKLALATLAASPIYATLDQSNNRNGPLGVAELDTGLEDWLFNGVGTDDWRSMLQD